MANTKTDMNPVIRNIILILVLAIIYNVWLALYTNEAIPYLAVTLVNGTIGYSLLKGTPLAKRFLVALAPFSLFIIPIYTECTFEQIAWPVILQVMIVGLVVVQLWEVVLWLVSGFRRNES